ncbi:MAG: hypothetical protein WAM97_16335 [Acidimicrobiales bacterium]
MFASLLISLVAIGSSVVLGSAPASAQSGPACSFNASTLGIVTGITEGGKVQIDCTGLPDDHPYLVLEISLLVALDPNTAGLLSGNISPSLLISALSAVPQINPLALEVTSSDSSGNLSYSYTTPTNQPLDPNATCPPSTEEFNSGLLGCAIAMVDLTSGQELGAGSALLEYQGFPFFPPNPGLKIKPKNVTSGESVNVEYPKNNTTYWWLATLADLEGDLSGGTGPDGAMAINIGGVAQNVPNTISVTAASYNGTTFTPPQISGGFTIPTTSVTGKHYAVAEYTATLEGLPLGMKARELINISPSP